MSGLAGVFLHNDVAQKSQIAAMLDVMKHRADYQSISIFNGHVGLGSFYHAFEDEKKSSCYNSERDVCVCIDGNIFSMPDEDALLHQKTLDAELVLDMYLKSGDSCFKKIDGSYAVAIWDGLSKKLILAKDRLGTKPLYYAKVNDSFIFASEIKAILQLGRLEKEIDLIALNNFLSYGHVPNPATLFKHIHQVKPGYVVEFMNGEILQRAYWKFQYFEEIHRQSEKEYIDEFYDIFKSAVNRRVRRHPDVGAFLSGGLDTSGVVSMMKILKEEPFKTFTAGFEEKAYDETDDAVVVAQHVGVEHILTKVKFDHSFLELLEKIVWHHDAPFSDTSAIPSYHAAKLAKKHVDMVLTGDFPDQLIGGSGHHSFILDRDAGDPLLKKIYRQMNLHSFISGIPVAAGTSGLIDKIKRFVYRESFPLEEQRVLMSMPIPPWLKNYLYEPSFRDVNKKSDPMDVARSMYYEVADQGLLNKLLYFDVLSYAVDDLMIKVERMTSANGLEAVSPFHDWDLVKFIAGMPQDLKIKGSRRKYVMWKALKPLLPQHTMNKKKQGFAMPIGEWLVRNLSDYVRQILLDSRTLNRGYFEKKNMTRMIENFLSGKSDYASGSEGTIITLITVELWHRLFID